MLTLLSDGPVRRVVSERAAVAEADPRGASIDCLFDSERAVIAGAVPQRQQEYAAGRLLARDLFQRLGVGPVALPTGPGRVPLWPHGVVGSITHCRGHVAVAVARSAQLRSIGCDVEPALALPEEVRDRVVTRAERDLLPTDVVWCDRLVFSAKEAAFKAQFPLTGLMLDFDDVHIFLQMDTGTFLAQVQRPGLPSDIAPALVGRFHVSDGLMATAVEVPA